MKALISPEPMSSQCQTVTSASTVEKRSSR